ncbi:hypothetical protein TRFO_25933 [Tritrichomonas foetus]|uniref:Uncharacterized protein n=1 Tax=Tritrichomonas foetus TaxID=1144522 RepID=A0A1J4K5J2_9EUKA|nr:hypothetical protein TRFO_25933 [Tritrichomonas foetus]|eukprot:OHT06144.1 hypothetical protein TRFO_25933 [Tritrichomonas foetus]
MFVIFVFFACARRSKHYFYKNDDSESSATTTPTPSPTFEISPQDMDYLPDSRRDYRKEYQMNYYSNVLQVNQMKNLDQVLYSEFMPTYQLPTKRKKLDMMIQSKDQPHISIMNPRYCCTCTFRKIVNMTGENDKKILKLQQKIQHYKRLHRKHQIKKKYKEKYSKQYVHVLPKSLTHDSSIESFV